MEMSEVLGEDLEKIYEKENRQKRALIRKLNRELEWAYKQYRENLKKLKFKNEIRDLERQIYEKAGLTLRS